MKKYKNLFFIISAMLVPLPSLFWLPANEVLAHGLIYPWPGAIMMWNIAKTYLYSWSNLIGLGNIQTEPSGFLNFFYNAIFIAVGGSSHLGQVLLFYLGFAGILSSMFFLTRTLGFSRSASLIAGIFYLFSPMVMSGMPIEIINLRLLPFYISTPILFALVIRTLNYESIKREICFFGVISVILGSTGYSSMQYFVVYIILIDLYIAYLIVLEWLNQGNHKKVIKRSFALIIITLLANLYWLIPLLVAFPQAYIARAEPGLSDLTIISGLSVKLIDGFRMLPYPAQTIMSPWVRYYYTPLVTLITFAFISIAGYALWSRNTKRAAIFPGLLLIVSLFLSKGIAEPLGAVGKAVFLSSPYVTRLFRNPNYFSILSIFAISLLLGLAAGEFIRKASSKVWRYYLTLTTIAVILVIYGWQFMIGGPIRSQPTSSPQVVNVPTYFSKLAQFLSKDSDKYRILSVPTFTPKSSFVAYNWPKKYIGVPILNLWSGKSPVSPLYSASNGVNPLFDMALHPVANNVDQNTWRAVLRFTNVKYVTVHNDSDWKFINKTEPYVSEKGIKEFISNATFIKKIGMFGKIDLFKVDAKTLLPYIYSATDLVVVSGNMNDLPAVSRITKETDLVIFLKQIPKEQKEFLLKKSKNFLKIQPVKMSKHVHQSTEANNISALETWKNIKNLKPPKIIFNKINPTENSIEIIKAKRPYFLTLSEAFNPGWKAYDGRINWLEALWQKPIPEKYHFKVNGYANAWYIDKPGNYEMTLYFWPQSLFYIGLIVSGLTFFGCVGYLAYDWRKRGVEL